MDPSVVCLQGDWMNYLPAAAVGLFLYEVLVPIGLFLIFKKVKEHKADRVFRLVVFQLY